PKKLADKLVGPPTKSNMNWSGGSPYQPRTNEPALNLWFTRIDPATGNYLYVGLWTAELFDKDGCVFGQVVAGGEDKGLLAPLSAPSSGGGVRMVSSLPGGGGFSSSSFGGGFGSSGGSGGFTTFSSGPRSSVTWFTFEVFPRREKEFKLRVYDRSGGQVAEFMVPNPAPIPSAQ